MPGRPAQFLYAPNPETEGSYTMAERMFSHIEIENDGCKKPHKHPGKCTESKLVAEIEVEDLEWDLKGRPGESMTALRKRAVKEVKAYRAAIMLARKCVIQAQQTFMRYAEIEGKRFSKTDMKDIWGSTIDTLDRR